MGKISLPNTSHSNTDDPIEREMIQHVVMAIIFNGINVILLHDNLILVQISNCANPDDAMKLAVNIINSRIRERIMGMIQCKLYLLAKLNNAQQYM